jgi:hypothetical protein
MIPVTRGGGMGMGMSMKRCVCGDKHICAMHARDFYNGLMVIRPRHLPSRRVIYDGMLDPWMDMPLHGFGPGMFCCAWREFTSTSPEMVSPTPN